MPVTDEEAAIEAISTLDPLSSEQQDAQQQLQNLMCSEDPFVDIEEYFRLYNILYFRKLLLPRVEVSWSSRLTLCAGICELVRDPNNDNKYTRIRLKLSEPLLKYRSKMDVINTLLHETIHAYFFVTTSWRHSRGDDGTGHGSGFLLLADAINSHGGYEVTVFHTFHDEVDSYRTHVWQCDGECQHKPPFFGLVKRSMNRPPGKSDSWWSAHVQDCGGTFSKIAEPEITKQQLEHMSGLKRAGKQRNKMDRYIAKSKQPDADNSKTRERLISVEEDSVKKRRISFSNDLDAAKKARTLIQCPICNEEMNSDGINAHLDQQHPS